MLGRTARAIASLCAAALTAGCGAPHQSAGDVAYLFQGFDGFENRMQTLCGLLAERRSAPNLASLELDRETCGTAGAKAQNLVGLKELRLHDYRYDAEDEGNGKNQILSVRFRSELWLNHTLAGLGSRLVTMATKAGVKVGGGGGLEAGTDITPQLPESIPAKDLLKFKLTLTEPPKIDAEALEFSVGVHLEVTGAAAISNDVRLTGKVIGDAVAIAIETVGEPPPLKKSLLRSFKVLTILSTYGDDTYFGTTMDLKVYSLGYADLVAAQMRDIVASSAALAVGVLTP